jgi:pyruvate dehydrogenase E1 component alpha subunit
MVAEIFGKRTGVAGGRSGSAHLSDNKVNMFSAPILGSYVALACGAALAFKMDKKNNIAAAFFGDAAIEEGVFAESLNFALTKKLPVLFICENNFFSTHIPLNLRQPARPIYKRMAGAGVISARVDGNDAARVFSEASKYIAGIRKGSGPVFLECVTYRYREHVGPNFDFENPYRKRADFDRWIKRCPLACMEKFMLRERYAGADLIRRINEEALGKVRRSIELPERPVARHKDL